MIALPIRDRRVDRSTWADAWRLARTTGRVLGHPYVATLERCVDPRTPDGAAVLLAGFLLRERWRLRHADVSLEAERLRVVHGRMGRWSVGMLLRDCDLSVGRVP